MEATLTLTNFLGPKTFGKSAFVTAYERNRQATLSMCHKFLLVEERMSRNAKINVTNVVSFYLFFF